jgi:hypothetical protein
LTSAKHQVQESADVSETCNWPSFTKLDSPPFAIPAGNPTDLPSAFGCNSQVSTGKRVNISEACHWINAWLRFKRSKCTNPNGTHRAPIPCRKTRSAPCTQVSPPSSEYSANVPFVPCPAITSRPFASWTPPGGPTDTTPIAPVMLMGGDLKCCGTMHCGIGKR